MRGPASLPVVAICHLPTMMCSVATPPLELFLSCGADKNTQPLPAAGPARFLAEAGRGVAAMRHPLRRIPSALRPAVMELEKSGFSAPTLADFRRLDFPLPPAGPAARAGPAIGELKKSSAARGESISLYWRQIPPGRQIPAQMLRSGTRDVEYGIDSPSRMPQLLAQSKSWPRVRGPPGARASPTPQTLRSTHWTVVTALLKAPHQVFSFLLPLLFRC